MSTTLAARAKRQTLILATIGGIHVGAFILVGMGLGTNLGLPTLPQGPITVFVPPPPPTPPIEPGSVPDPGYGIPEAPKPPVEFPLFDGGQDPALGIEMKSGIAVGTDPVAPLSDYGAPTLRIRDSRLAALIDACYPAASRRLGEEGRVVARVTIDAAGRPIAWSVEQSSGFVHLDSVVDCVIRRLEFIPGRRDGRGVEATVMLPIVFRLD
jgi:protein TonB